MLNPPQWSYPPILSVSYQDPADRVWMTVQFRMGAMKRLGGRTGLWWVDEIEESNVCNAEGVKRRNS